MSTEGSGRARPFWSLRGHAMKMKPLAIPTIPSMTALGIEMREVADKYPDNDKPFYSNNETEVAERHVGTPEKRRPGEWMWEVGLSRGIQYDNEGRIVTLCITREEFENPPQYRLSMCLVTPGRQVYAAVPDERATLIAACVLGPGAKAVVNPSGIENAKHFVRTIQTANDGQNRKQDD